MPSKEKLWAIVWCEDLSTVSERSRRAGGEHKSGKGATRPNWGKFKEGNCSLLTPQSNPRKITKISTNGDLRVCGLWFGSREVRGSVSR